MVYLLLINNIFWEDIYVILLDADYFKFIYIIPAWYTWEKSLHFKDQTLRPPRGRYHQSRLYFQRRRISHHETVHCLMLNFKLAVNCNINNAYFCD